jgi:hypothetical protein
MTLQINFSPVIVLENVADAFPEIRRRKCGADQPDSDLASGLRVRPA